MNRADQPTELHLGHDELDRLESLAGAGTIIEQKQNPGAHLDREQKQRHAPEIIPKGVTVQRHLFLFGELGEVAQTNPLIEPEIQFAAFWAVVFHPLSPSY